MSDQHLLSLTILSLLGLFIWGKFRYDALAAGALVVLIILGVIPANQAFDGFAHPAVITVALVLIISQGLKNSGLTGLVGKVIGGKTFTQFQFLISLLFIAAILSSFINNIGALAILLPITLNICQKMDWHPSRFLMPLAFACILGGMNTTIGTPPNIIISEYKSTISNAGFNFFDFSYVGLSVTILSILFISITLGSFSLAWGQEETNAEVFFREDQFYLGASFMILQSDQEDFSPRGLSRHFQWGFIRDIPIIPSGKIALGLGLGMSFERYNTNLNLDESEVNPVKFLITDESISPLFFSIHSFELPLTLRWRNATPDNFAFWRVYGLSLIHI